MRFAERGFELRQQRVELARIARHERAELVTAETVGRPAVAHGALETPRELREQPVAFEMPERVVVVLEAVEVEEDQRRRLVRRRDGDRAIEILDEQAAVAELRQVVRQRLRTRHLEPAFQPDGVRHPHECAEQRRRREHGRSGADLAAADHEQPHRDSRGRHGEHESPHPRGTAAASAGGGSHAAAASISSPVAHATSITCPPVHCVFT